MGAEGFHLYSCPKFCKYYSELLFGTKDREAEVGWFVSIPINSKGSYCAPGTCWVLAVSLTSCVCTGALFLSVLLFHLSKMKGW